MTIDQTTGLTQRGFHFSGFSALAIVTLLATGCAATPPVPYTEPSAATPTANVRLITNGQVRGAVFSACPVNGTLMAEAGRFKNDRASINFPQYPVTPTSLNMPPRATPTLLEYMSPTRMANGPYREVVTEYKVPAGKPFAFHFFGATAGGFSSTYLVCPMATGVFEFVAGENYEVGIGMIAHTVEGKQQIGCIMRAVRLLSLPGAEISLPFPVSQVISPAPNCKK
ncbi:MAG: amidase [Pseudomonas sp.]